MVAGENNVRSALRLERTSRWDGWSIALGGGIVLPGWLLENDMLKRDAEQLLNTVAGVISKPTRASVAD